MEIDRRSLSSISLFLLLLFSFISVHTVAEVITLTPETFSDKIKEKDTAWFVKFCVPWCKHCKNLGTLWEDLGKTMEGEDEIEIGEVDCGLSKSVCNKVDIHSYPTFKLFYNGEEVAKYQDHVFNETCSNSRVYELLTTDIIHAAVEGFNGTAFAYGQTSSGKTFTMNGSANDPGIIQRAVKDIFQKTQSTSDREFLIRVSYMEIYNEEINDLLSLEDQKLQIHESLERGIFVAGLKEEIVSDAEHVLQLLESGEVKRHFGETNMNVRSSRSHTIFRMAFLKLRHESMVEHIFMVESSGKQFELVLDFRMDLILDNLWTLCLVLGIEFKDEVSKIHPTLEDGNGIKDVRDITIAQLAAAIKPSSSKVKKSSYYLSFLEN